jgi:16S rRNA (guanine966-N2)-methyltransferase
MRIISGEYKGRKVEAPSGDLVRPTPEWVREALFNILGGSLGGFVFADLFAGAGTIGLEAASRGARKVILVECDPKALAFLRKNIERIGCADRCRIITRRVETLSASDLNEASVVFLDPPYHNHPDLPNLGRFLEEVRPAPLVVYQHGRGDTLPPGSESNEVDSGWRPGWVPPRMKIIDERRYGRSFLTFYSDEEEIPCP